MNGVLRCDAVSVAGGPWKSRQQKSKRHPPAFSGRERKMKKKIIINSLAVTQRRANWNRTIDDQRNQHNMASIFRLVTADQPIMFHLKRFPHHADHLKASSRSSIPPEVQPPELTTSIRPSFANDPFISSKNHLLRLFVARNDSVRSRPSRSEEAS